MNELCKQYDCDLCPHGVCAREHDCGFCFMEREVEAWAEEQARWYRENWEASDETTEA